MAKTSATLAKAEGRASMTEGKVAPAQIAFKLKGIMRQMVYGYQEYNGN